ncbi:MAG: RagB/SusD family nutrient uptake outer membrane protein [Prevotella sp.]|nr:RagB/SusD family nutrient uptake outer membrane protein [Prevotella sp.]MDD7045757.1 RagB/SusD family nutrient uptake outer membrane protein [Prevotella sp.]MDY5547424.1 RagB/SusD family nutrient uptake outer membrane protein [Prevotella sp.]
MSKLRNIIWMGAFTLACASCSDEYMNTPPAHLVSSESFYKTASQVDQAVVGLYADMQLVDYNGYHFMSECRSDNYWVDPQPNALREYSEIGSFRATWTLTTFNDLWNLLYKTIYDSNILLSKIDGAEFKSESMKNQFTGEARFMRGWAYLELARFFGNVPIINRPVTPSESKSIGQSTPREVFDQMVIPDLTEAAKLLPVKKSLVDANSKSVAASGRADKVAAQAMLARAYMTLAGYPFNDASAKANAKTVLQEVLAKESSYFAPNMTEWKKQWMPSSDYYNKYTIFAVQHRLKENNNYVVFNSTPELAPSRTSIRMMGNSIWVEKSLAYEFEKNNHADQRGLGTCTLEDQAAETNYAGYANETGTYTDENGVSHDVLLRTICQKWVPTKEKLAAVGMSFDEGTLTNYYDWPTNFPVLRMEDMMLLYAEILADEGDITGAMSYVNKIRARAGVDQPTASSKEEAMKYIKRERRLELLGEGVRWFDEIRYGEWKTDTENMFNRYNNPEGTSLDFLKNYLYPIPQNQYNAVQSGLYKQNDGYSM